jgi:hypothetical protein
MDLKPDASDAGIASFILNLVPTSRTMSDGHQILKQPLR